MSHVFHYTAIRILGLPEKTYCEDGDEPEKVNEIQYLFKILKIDHCFRSDQA